jgi:cell division protein FtsN
VDGKWQIVGKRIEREPPIRYPYSVHYGSYRSRQDATKWVDTLRRNGLPAYRVRAYLGAEKGTWYRVMIGWYPTETEARSVITENQLEGVSPIRSGFACRVGVYPSLEDLRERIRLLGDYKHEAYGIEDGMGRHFLYVGAFVYRTSAERRSRQLLSMGTPSQVVAR